MILFQTIFLDWKVDEMKICNKCENISPKTDSYKNKKNEDDYLNECTKCSKDYAIRNQEKLNFTKTICSTK